MNKKTYGTPHLTVHGDIETITLGRGNGHGPPTEIGNGRGNRGRGLGNGGPSSDVVVGPFIAVSSV
jgi:hypothetical protein